MAKLKDTTIEKATTGGQNQIAFKEAGTTKTQITSNYGDDKFYLYHEGDNRLTIDSSGNIGIGTTAPTQLLDVNGNTSIRGNLLLTGTATTTNQGRMIDFTGFDKEGTTDFSDRAYIQHTTNTGGHSGSVLVISSQNDASDGIAFQTNGSSQLKHNSNVIWDAGNDGPGSGLNADLLDGKEASEFAYSDFVNNAYIDFTVNGNADTYYPVSIAGGGQYAFQMYSISRQYNWTAPNTWNTSTHRGGLTLTWQYSGDSFWGGNDHDFRIIKFDETYTTMVTKMAGSVGGGGLNSGVVVWLRGGGALYRFHGPKGKDGDVNIHLTTVTGSNSQTYAPMSYSSSDVSSTISARYPIRGEASLYDGNNKVWHAGNDGAGSGLDADTLDTYQASQFLRSDADDTYTGTLTLANDSYISMPAGNAEGIKFGDVVMSYVGTSYDDLTIRNLKQLRFGSTNDWDWNKWAGIGYDTANFKLYIGGPASSYFQANTSPSNIDVVFDGVDNVGIGTTSPSEKLHIDGNVRIEGDLTVNGSYTQIDTNTSTTEQWTVTNDGTGPAVIINQTGSQPIMDVQDDGTSAFYIEDGGNVGIKTTNPTTTLQVAGRVLANSLSTTTANTRDKIRLWDTSNQYTIGMQSNYSFGGLNNDYAMTFQFNNDNDRGFWWGDEAHSQSQGAMALTTNGLLTVASKIRVGYGESDTTIPTTYTLDVNGDIKADNLYLGADDQTPKIDMLFDDHASGVVWDTRIEIGKSDDFDSSGPSYVPSTNAYGMNLKANSDGVFFGLEQYSTGNFRPIINWGDDTTDSPFSIRYNNSDRLTLDTTGNLTVSNDLYGKSSNGQYSNLYRWGGIFFTWDSDSYGTNTHHSIRSTYGDTYGDSITLNSFGHIRMNIDSNNNGTNYFEVGGHTTGTSNTHFQISDTGTVVFPGLSLGISNTNADPGTGTYFRGNSTHFVLGLDSGNTLYLNYGNSAGNFRTYGTHYHNDNAVGTPWGSSNDGSGSGLDADTLDTKHASDFVAVTGDTMTGTLTIDTGAGSEDALVIKGTAPTINLLDDSGGYDDFYLHANSNNFYILTDRDGANQTGTGWESPHPLQLEADTNIGYVFGQRIFNELYHPNADKWTTARTITLGGDLTGSVSLDGSANVTLSAQVVDDSHNHTISNVSGLQAALDDKAEVTYTSGGTTTDVSTLNFNLNTSTQTLTITTS